MKQFKKYLEIIQESSVERIRVMQDKRFKDFNEFVPKRYDSSFIGFIPSISSKDFTGNTSTGDKKEISNYKEEIDKFIELIIILKNNPGIKDEINVILNLVKEEIQKNKDKVFKSDIEKDFLEKLNKQYISPPKI